MKTAEQLIEELGIQDLDTFMESAEFEQLDELSKTTLSKYIKKAAFRVGIHGMNAGEAKVGSKENKVANDKMGKRYLGILKAANKLANEETELNLEDYSLEELQDFMMSEDFEQLDELSKETLASYIGKASKAYAKHDKQLGLADKANWEKISREDRQKYDKNVRKVSGNKGSLDTNDYDTHDSYHLGKLVKREKGISKAVGKLTKESVEAMVSAVLDGDQESASDAFSQAIGEMISDRMDAIKQDIASGL